MKQMQVTGVTIEEYSDRSEEIQIDIEDLLNMAARAHLFNWMAPTHDIVRRLMNQVHEFKPEGGEQNDNH